MYSDIESVRRLILLLAQEKNISINKLASLSGLTQSTLDSLLKGKSKNPKIQTLHKIANGLDIPYDEFVRLIHSIETDINPNGSNDNFFDEQYDDRAFLIAGEKLKSIRISKGISMYEIVKILKISSDYEQGDFGVHPLSTLIALADFFDVSLDYLVGRSDVAERR